MVSTISTAKNAQCARIEAFCSFFLKLNELIESITSCMYLAGATYASKEIVCMRRAKGIATIKTNLFFLLFYSKAFSWALQFFLSGFISRDYSCRIFIVGKASVQRIYLQNRYEKLVLLMDATNAIKTKKYFERKSGNQYNLWPSASTRWTK